MSARLKLGHVLAGSGCAPAGWLAGVFAAAWLKPTANVPSVGLVYLLFLFC